MNVQTHTRPLNHHLQTVHYPTNPNTHHQPISPSTRPNIHPLINRTKSHPLTHQLVPLTSSTTRLDVLTSMQPFVSGAPSPTVHVASPMKGICLCLGCSKVEYGGFVLFVIMAWGCVLEGFCPGFFCPRGVCPYTV